MEQFRFIRTFRTGLDHPARSEPPVLVMSWDRQQRGAENEESGCAAPTEESSPWRLLYDVGFWRPFQAIAAAESDGNPGTLPPPGTWVSLVPERPYATLSALEHDALRARIWGGLHFRDAMDDGYLLGHTVADHVIAAIR